MKRLALMLGAGLVLVACGTATHHTSLTASPAAVTSTTSQNDNSQGDEINQNYDISPHVHAYPGRPGDQPKITKAQAYTAYKGLGIEDYEAESGHPVVEHWGRITADDIGQDQGNGQVAKSINDQLMWVLTFTNVPCVASRSGATPQSIPSVSHPLVESCTSVVLVDGNTGVAEAGFESSGRL